MYNKSVVSNEFVLYLCFEMRSSFVVSVWLSVLTFLCMYICKPSNVTGLIS